MSPEMPMLPDTFQHRIKNSFDNGEEWLANLPRLITQCEAQFHIQVNKPIEDLSYNYIAHATTKEGQDCILKLGCDKKEIARECEALKEMHSPSIVKLLNQDNTLCAMLLERLTPGNTLAKTPEMEANEVCAQVIENIVKPYDGDYPFPKTADWFKDLNDDVELPADMNPKHLDKARGLARELHESLDDEVLLHGDLHHFNILKSDCHALGAHNDDEANASTIKAHNDDNHSAWVAIDPKGVMGEKACEVGAFLRNPIPGIAYERNLRDILASRIDFFAGRLSLDHQRIAAWGFAGAMLATHWCLQSNNPDWKVFYACAEALA